MKHKFLPNTQQSNELTARCGIGLAGHLGHNIKSKLICEAIFYGSIFHEPIFMSQSTKEAEVFHKQHAQKHGLLRRSFYCSGFRYSEEVYSTSFHPRLKV